MTIRKKPSSIAQKKINDKKYLKIIHLKNLPQKEVTVLEKDETFC
jgi:hypothetical protein